MRYSVENARHIQESSLSFGAERQVIIMAFEIADIEAALPGSRTLPRRSTWELVQLSLFWIATNYHWAAIPIIILPSQLRVYLLLHHPAGLSGSAVPAYISSSIAGTLALVAGPGL